MRTFRALRHMGRVLCVTAQVPCIHSSDGEVHVGGGAMLYFRGLRRRMGVLDGASCVGSGAGVGVAIFDTPFLPVCIFVSEWTPGQLTRRLQLNKSRFSCRDGVIVMSVVLTGRGSLSKAQGWLVSRSETVVTFDLSPLFQRSGTRKHTLNELNFVLKQYNYCTGAHLSKGLRKL